MTFYVYMQLNVSDVLFCFSVVFLCVCLKLRKKENNVCCCPRLIVVLCVFVCGELLQTRETWYLARSGDDRLLLGSQLTLTSSLLA